MQTDPRPLAVFGRVFLAAGLACLAACVSKPEVDAPTPPAAAPLPVKDIWTAAQEGDLDALRAHKQAGANFDSRQPEVGVTPLVIAIGSRQQRAIEWLLDNGVNVDATNFDGGTAMHAAAFMGNAWAAGLLLERGADAELRDENGASPGDILALDWPTTEYVAQTIGLELNQQTVESARALIADMLGTGDDDAARAEAALWQAAVAGNAAAVRSRIQDGADVDAVSATGAPLLLVAAFLGHVDVVAALCDAGAQINAAHTESGSTALHAAAFLGHVAVADLLLAKGADAKAQSRNGRTARQAAEIDWPTTEYITTVLQVEVQQDEVMARRAEILAMLPD